MQCTSVYHFWISMIFGYLWNVVGHSLKCMEHFSYNLLNYEQLLFSEFISTVVPPRRLYLPPLSSSLVQLKAPAAYIAVLAFRPAVIPLRQMGCIIHRASLGHVHS